MRSNAMLKKFPDLKTDQEADDWLQNADLGEYDLSEGLKKVRFELVREEERVSLPTTLLDQMNALAVARDTPTQQLIEQAIGEFLQRAAPKHGKGLGKTRAKKAPSKTP